MTTRSLRASTGSTSGNSSTATDHGRGLDDVEFATMTYVDWFNHRRLHGEITNDNSYSTPAEFEAAYYHQTTTALEAVTQ
jgi:transposase InsO family protein